ncbi:hypothetical protein Q1695_013012 [Nippostrongylus brasiliensis]|nr:hypothetical protein Q1695_013012 [Nippostrongylus brasiliensis]
MCQCSRRQSAKSAQISCRNEALDVRRGVAESLHGKGENQCHEWLLDRHSCPSAGRFPVLLDRLPRDLLTSSVFDDKVSLHIGTPKAKGHRERSNPTELAYPKGQEASELVFG